MSAAGQEPSGLVVTVTFRGNLQQAIGRRDLKNAAVAMILEPKSAGPAEAAVVTQGPGAIGQTLRRTRSTQVGVVRAGRILEFFVHGPGVSQVGQVVVKAFAVRPTGKGRSLENSGAPGTISATDLEALDRGVAYDRDAVDLEKSLLLRTPCNELGAMRTLVANTKANTLRADAALATLQSALEQQIASLRAKPLSKRKVGRLWKKIAARVGPYLDPGSAPTDSLGLVTNLERYLEQVKAAKQRADFLLAAETDFLNEIEDRMRSCFNNFPLSAGYDHTTPGNPPSAFPSTVCADFGPQTFFHEGDSWHAYLEDENGNQLKSTDGTFASENGTGRVVFGIPKPGTYFIRVEVPAGSDVASVRIAVPTPPPFDKSKDCSAPPPPA